jgi:hypothetical protein
LAPVPVHPTILNPLVVDADTVDVILPSVLDAVVFEANQFHDTLLSPLSFTLASLPKVKPSEPKAVNPFATVASAESLSEPITSVTPLTESYI